MAFTETCKYIGEWKVQKEILNKEHGYLITLSKGQI